MKVTIKHEVDKKLGKVIEKVNSKVKAISQKQAIKIVERDEKPEVNVVRLSGSAMPVISETQEQQVVEEERETN